MVLKFGADSVLTNFESSRKSFGSLPLTSSLKSDIKSRRYFFFEVVVELYCLCRALGVPKSPASLSRPFLVCVPCTVLKPVEVLSLRLVLRMRNYS